MPNALDTLFETASALPQVPGDNQVLVQVITGTLINAETTELLSFEGIMNFTKAVGREEPPGLPFEPAYFSGSGFTDPQSPSDSPSNVIANQTVMRLSASRPRRGGFGDSYTLSVESPILSGAFAAFGTTVKQGYSIYTYNGATMLVTVPFVIDL
jgi:hypothetical protein